MSCDPEAILAKTTSHCLQTRFKPAFFRKGKTTYINLNLLLSIHGISRDEILGDKGIFFTRAMKIPDRAEGKKTECHGSFSPFPPDPTISVSLQPGEEEPTFVTMGFNSYSFATSEATAWKKGDKGNGQFGQEKSKENERKDGSLYVQSTPCLLCQLFQWDFMKGTLYSKDIMP